MTYSEIKEIIEKDYTELEQTRKLVAMRGGRGSTKTFYLNFSKAMDELHIAVGPFTTSKEQFIDHIRYLKTKTDSIVYKIIVQYCNDKLKLTI